MSVFFFGDSVLLLTKPNNFQVSPPMVKIICHCLPLPPTTSGSKFYNLYLQLFLSPTCSTHSSLFAYLSKHPTELTSDILLFYKVMLYASLNSFRYHHLVEDTCLLWSGHSIGKLQPCWGCPLIEASFRSSALSHHPWVSLFHPSSSSSLIIPVSWCLHELLVCFLYLVS